LIAWQNFYIIVGSSAGTLTGLLFVVVTLISGRSREAATWGTMTFTTPTVVHFAAVLSITALLSAPWPATRPPALLLGVVGAAGFGYSLLVLRRMRRRIGYEPVGEDWLYFVIAPTVAYLVLFGMALLFVVRPEAALFGIGAVLLLLLLVGVRNAWDLATYIGIGPDPPRNELTESGEPGREPAAPDAEDSSATRMPQPNR
jgi:hypothetical protein